MPAARASAKRSTRRGTAKGRRTKKAKTTPPSSPAAAAAAAAVSMKKKKTSTKKNSTRRRRRQPVHSSDTEEEDEETALLDYVASHMDDEDNASAASLFDDAQLSCVWSANPSKARAEYLAVWWAIVLVVLTASIGISHIYEEFNKESYLWLGIVAGMPPLLFPILFPGGADAGRPLLQRFSTKANVFAAVMTLVSGYFLVAYFKILFGIEFTFPSHQWNDVPVVVYLAGHAFFLVSLIMGGLMQRYLLNVGVRVGWPQPLTWAVVAFAVMALAYSFALVDVTTATQFSGITVKEIDAFMTRGALMEASFFMVSLPLFFWIDERVTYSITRTFVDAMGACMIIVIIIEMLRQHWGLPVQQGK